MSEQTVQEKLVAKVTAVLGDVLEAKDIEAITKQALTEALTKPRRVPRDYGRVDEQEPVLVELARKVYAEEANKQIRKWLDENRNLIASQIEKVIAQGILQTTIAQLDQIIKAPLQQLAYDLRQRGITV